MSAPVNLNKARKARAKADKRATADANAVKFGRTKADKAVEHATETARVQRLDAHKRDR